MITKPKIENKICNATYILLETLAFLYDLIPNIQYCDAKKPEITKYIEAKILSSVSIGSYTKIDSNKIRTKKIKTTETNKPINNRKIDMDLLMIVSFVLLF